MSITAETVKQHLKDPAVLCCRREKGTVLSAEDLEDPTLFDDMVDADLMTLSDDGLTIEQVIGATLTKNSDALLQLTADMIDKINDVKASDPTPETKEDNEVPLTPHYAATSTSDMIELEIDKLEGLKMKLPVGLSVAGLTNKQSVADPGTGAKKVIRQLKKKHIKITDAEIGSQTRIESGKITVDIGLIKDAIKADTLVKDIKLDVIKPDNRHVYTDTIMDVCPIATKVEGELGGGVTKICDGVVFMLTGIDESGTQVHEFGSSDGYLDEKMYFGHPGCADENDIIIRCEAVIEKLSGMSRPGPLAAHKAQDVIIQAVRDELKNYDGEVVREEICEDIRRKGNPRIVLVKEIMGQGAMHDNVICPTEPCGVAGGQMNVDCGNVPIMLTPNQVRDGSIHALTCIGPATKEMTRHYIREPLVEPTGCR